MEKTRTEMIARTVRLFAIHTHAPVNLISDGKVHISDGKVHLIPDVELLYKTIRELGKETWFKIYPGEGHRFTYCGSPGAIGGNFQETIEFFERMLKSAND